MSDVSERIANLPPEKRALLEQRLLQKHAHAAQIQKVPRRRTSGPCPLSFAQQRLWFLHQLEPGSPVYNIPTALHLSGPLDVRALEQSLNETVRRHESLRTTFSSVNGSPVQVIAPKLVLELPIVDLSGLSKAEQDAKAERLANEEIQRPFDLEQGPMLRATLLRLEQEEHEFILTMHHIVSDGWSKGVLLRELSALYGAFCNGASSPLPDLPVQYADFAVWQREWMQGEVLEAQLGYWKVQLEGMPPALELPTDRPRPAVQTLRGARRSLTLSQSLTEGLKALSQHEGTTLFMTLLAAFKVLLYRYTGRENIAVGAPIANRTRAEVENLIGFFVNTLVMRTSLVGDPSFRELLGRVREVALEAYANQDLPFEMLVEEVQPERDLSRTPLFQVVFALQNVPAQNLELPALSVEPLETKSKTAKFDLSLLMIEEKGELRGTLEYSTDLFDAATIERMIGHFQTLLEGVLADPDQLISTLPMLTEAERRQVLVEWNDTQTHYPKHMSIHELFEDQAAHRADAVAVVFEDQKLTYGQLNSRANQLAHYLLSLGVGPEKLVGICMERSLEAIVGILGTLKSGGAFLPLDPKYPPERLAFMLEDAQASVLLTQERLMERLPKCRSQIICLDSDWGLMADHSQGNPASGARPDNLAYVIYTSGSSGQPKGVEIEHTSLVNLITWHQNVFHVTATDRATQLAGPAFDASVWEIWPYLTAGATIYVPLEDTLLSPARLVEWLAANEITITFLPTPLAESVLVEEWPADLALRILLTGGDRLRHAPRRKLPFVLVNNYGPTENTVVSTWTHVTEGDHSSPPPIGRPVFNTQIYVLDAHRQPAPIGVPGELYVGGAGLARGYLNRADLTADRFIPNPFSQKPGARLYKTGDLARLLPDGNIEFLGRFDNQVKIRGFRIELGEIEAVLGRHAAVRECVVVAREDRPGEKRLVAYVVPNKDRDAKTRELRSFLKRELPEVMVPSAFVALNDLPLTPNGKIDRRVLPKPEQARPNFDETFEPPREGLERRLAAIWEQVLGVQPIGVRDNFFELGGHSLLAVRLIAQIEEMTDQNLPLATLFQAPTIEQLAHILGQEVESASQSSVVAIQSTGSKPPFYCIPGNMGNVFVDLGDLTRHLGPEQPFFGLQDGIHNPSQIEALAARYLEEIQAVQPRGPYLLGGICFGGVVAFEMAQQLQAQGERVALLALVEPSSPRAPSLGFYLRLAISMVRRFVQRFGHHSRELGDRDSVEQKAYLRLKAKVVANMWALARYAPEPYPGTIHLFLTRGSLMLDQNPQLNWRRMAAGGVEIHEISGNHDWITGANDTEIEETHMQVLAEQLRACIDFSLTTSFPPEPVGHLPGSGLPEAGR
jgi:aspartate racemase